MVKYFKRLSVVILLGSLILTGCKEETVSFVYSDIIADADDANDYILDIYQDISVRGLFYDAFLIIPLVYSDQCVYVGNSTPNWKEASDFDFSPDNSMISSMFADFYNLNSQLNVVFAEMDTTDDVTLTDDVKDGFRAECRAMRAVIYYHLTNYWGDVPLILTDELPADSLITVTLQADLLDQIESDLLFAEENITKNTYILNDAQRLNLWSVKGWLARVYLQKGDYAKALSYAEDVINNSGASLEPFVSNIYSLSSSENLWVLADDLISTSLAVYFLQPFSGGQYVVRPRATLPFESGDLRRDVALSEPGTTILKYDDIGGNSDPVYMMRLSEMYLIAAEAAARSTGDYSTAEDYVNAIRDRAGLDDVSLNAGNFEDIILNEKNLELCYEGPQRWLDLKRTGRDVTTLGVYGYESTDNRWPFHNTFLENFKSVEQNPGY